MARQFGHDSGSKIAETLCYSGAGNRRLFLGFDQNRRLGSEPPRQANRWSPSQNRHGLQPHSSRNARTTMEPTAPPRPAEAMPVRWRIGQVRRPPVEGSGRGVPLRARRGPMPPPPLATLFRAGLPDFPSALPSPDNGTAFVWSFLFLRPPVGWPEFAGAPSPIMPSPACLQT